MNRKSKDRRRRSWPLLLAVPLAAATLGLSSSRSAPATFQLGRQGRLQVRQLEMGYRLADDSLKIRAHLVTGMAVDYRTTDAADIDRILKFSELLASGRAQLFVEIEGDAVKAFDASIP